MPDELTSDEAKDRRRHFRAISGACTWLKPDRANPCHPSAAASMPSSPYICLSPAVSICLSSAHMTTSNSCTLERLHTRHPSMFIIQHPVHDVLRLLIFCSEIVLCFRYKPIERHDVVWWKYLQSSFSKLHFMLKQFNMRHDISLSSLLFL